MKYFAAPSVVMRVVPNVQHLHELSSDFVQYGYTPARLDREMIISGVELTLSYLESS